MGTKADLVAGVQTVIGRDDKDATIGDFLSRAERFLASKYDLPGIFTVLAETLAASSQVIVLPPNVLRTAGVLYKDTTNEKGDTILPVSIEYFKEHYYYPAKGPSNPKYFAVDIPARRWRFSTYPSDDITIELEVVYTPIKISASQDSTIIEGDDAIIYLTASYVLRTLGEDSRANEHRAIAKEFAEALALAHSSKLSFVEGRES